MRPHISYSELSEFANNCQHRWKLQYLDGLRKEIFSIHFDFGTAIHEALERYFTRPSKAVTLDEAVKIFRETLTDLYHKNSPRYADKATIDELLVYGERILRRFNECPELQGAEAVQNEYPLFETIERTDGLDVKFKGYIDLVLRTKDKRGNKILYVCDFKTCSWGWDQDTRQDRWKHYQILLYKHFLCKKFDLDPKNVRTAFILLKKKPPFVSKGSTETHPPVEFFPISAGPVSVQRALDTLNENVTAMSKKEADGSFRKNRSACVDKFGNRCPFLETEHCT